MVYYMEPKYKLFLVTQETVQPAPHAVTTRTLNQMNVHERKPVQSFQGKDGEIYNTLYTIAALKRITTKKYTHESCVSAL